MSDGVPGGGAGGVRSSDDLRHTLERLEDDTDSDAVDGSRVAVIYGSANEHQVMGRVGAMLERFSVPYDETQLSPHRAPRTLLDWIAALEPRGVEVVIAGGGMSAALAGIVAAHVTMPVIGLPLSVTARNGLDAVMSMAMMPAGVPVATVGVDAATNAAILAIQILAVGDPLLRAQLAAFKDSFEQAAQW